MRSSHVSQSQMSNVSLHPIYLSKLNSFPQVSSPIATDFLLFIFSWFIILSTSTYEEKNESMMLAVENIYDPVIRDYIL